GGYGRYYDMSYTNINILNPGINATGIGAGLIFDVNVSSGIRNPDGTFFKVGDPISNIASQNGALGPPLNAEIASPRLRQPYNDQFSAGWSHQLNASTAIDVDYVHSEGRDYGLRLSLNQLDPGATVRHYSALAAPYGAFSPVNFTINVSDGKGR